MLAAVVGAGAGAVAVAMAAGIHLAVAGIVGTVAGYDVPTAAGDIDRWQHGGTGSMTRPWLLPFVLGAGALVSAAVVARWAPRAAGAGIDAALAARLDPDRPLTRREVVVKFVASSVLIGSGGSGGRAGPVAFMSAAWADQVARRCAVPGAQTRLLLSVAVGAGVGAVFGAPVAGAVLACEIAPRGDADPRALVPGLIAATMSTAIFSAFEGTSPFFGDIDLGAPAHGATAGIGLTPGTAAAVAVAVVSMGLVGVACGAAGRLFAAAMTVAARLGARLPRAAVTAPTLGAVAVGLLATAVPQVLGTGLGTVQRFLDPQTLAHVPWWLVVLLPLAKIVATAGSVGTGGSAGVVGPSLAIGAFTGAAVYRIVGGLGAEPALGPAVFVVAGMAACLGAAGRTPVAALALAVETTARLGVLLPAALAVAAALVVVRRRGATLYLHQSRDRAEEARAVAERRSG